MRVVFLGTPQFAVSSLAALAARHEVALVVSQPDRPRGRGRQTAPTPVKELALSLGLPVRQFERLREPEARAAFEAAGAEAAVVVAYGLLVPDWLIAMHRLGAVNAHGSLLPAWRGAAPINRAIMSGDAETGITTMQLVSRLDAGPVLLERRTPIGPAETAGELAARLADIAAELLLETLDGLAAGTVAPRPQDEERATYAPKLAKDEGRIRWDAPAGAIANLVRGVNPWPGAFTSAGGRTLKIWRAAPMECGKPVEMPGTVLAAAARDGLIVAAADDALSVLEAQWEGKRALPARELLRGTPIPVGSVLG